MSKIALSHADVRSGVGLLDVGCGAGGALLIARELGAKITGIDDSVNLVSIARAERPGGMEQPISVDSGNQVNRRMSLSLCSWH